MTELPDNWGYAEFEIYSIVNLDDSDKPTIVNLKMFGFVLGVDYVQSCSFVTNACTFNEVSEAISYNCVYPWVEGLYNKMTEPEGVL